MAINSNRLRWENLRSINSATLTGGYDALGTPLDHAAFIVKMVNNANVTVTVSIDGVNDIDVCPAGSFWLYDEFNDLPAGTQFYVNGSAGSGLIYLAVQYHVTS